MNDIRIRTANIGDLENIKELWLELHRYHMSLDSMRMYSINAWEIRMVGFARAIQNTDCGRVFLADIDNIIVGYLWCEIRHRDPGPRDLPDKYAEIESLLVNENARSYGVGSLLMKASDIWFEENKIEHVMLSALAGNDIAISFYKKHGYRPTTIIMERMK
jgi:ribosomal protein S18 acetylase RimI-like enzyme